jgi:hypothetical protein
VFVPAPAKQPLAVPIAQPADQVEPLYDSVHATATAPPKANAAVFVPAPAKVPLAVLIAPPADQVADNEYNLKLTQFVLVLFTYQTSPLAALTGLELTDCIDMPLNFLKSDIFLIYKINKI